MGISRGFMGKDKYWLIDVPWTHGRRLVLLTIWYASGRMPAAQFFKLSYPTRD